jgi:hypothetical protein
VTFSDVGSTPTASTIFSFCRSAPHRPAFDLGFDTLLHLMQRVRRVGGLTPYPVNSGAVAVFR